MFLYDFRAHPKPQAGALIAFGADKRFEKFPLDFRLNPGPGIGDGQTNTTTRTIAVFLSVGDADLEPAATRHGIGCISHQVQDHLAEIAGARENWPAFAKVPLNHNLCGPQPGMIEDKGGVHDLWDLHA